MKLKGRVALLTGANDGIGKAAAKLFAEQGAVVIVTGRRSEEGMAVERELGEIAGDPKAAMFIQADISSEEDTKRVIKRIADIFGRLDILVNCAAMQLGGTILEAQPEDYDRIFATNVKGYGMMMKEAIPYLNQSAHGAIVNIASLNGNIGIAGRSLYGMTKATVINLTQDAAADFPKIRVNCVSPGFTKSDAMLKGLMATGLPAEECERLITDGTVMKRFADPGEIAAAILFLASDDASYITGTNLMVDGGAFSVGRYDVAFERDPRVCGKK